MPLTISPVTDSVHLEKASLLNFSVNRIVEKKEVDKGKAVARTFIDFKKDFDCVQHEQLLTKLQGNLGILGPLC